jgi:hypothetical protein
LGIQNLPDLASQTAFVRQLYAYKVASMETPNQLSREAIEEFRAIYSIGRIETAHVFSKKTDLVSLSH